MTTLYGIPNCDTVKKARTWLDENKIDHEFHDFRKDGLNKVQVQSWLDTLGWETLINKRSTTWRTVDDAVKAQLSDDTQAIKLILEHPTLIKRPLLEYTQDKTSKFNLGFKAEQYQSIFG